MESRLVCLTRRYSFSAAHHLSSPFYDEEENRRLYGKCGRRAGHGHNYIIKISVKGPVDPRTGMVMNVLDMDEIVRKNVIEPLDRKNLNVELKDARILTSEVLVEFIWRRLSPFFQSPPLFRIEIDETRKNGFKYFGDRIMLPSALKHPADSDFS